VKQGRIEPARELYESLQDPPSGMAAPFNHPLGGRSHKRDPKGMLSSRESIYREPSTYDHMIRAEMAVGSEERAAAVLEKARQRAFPVAVMGRLERAFRNKLAFGDAILGD
jgi:hypothetical protein